MKRFKVYTLEKGLIDVDYLDTVMCLIRHRTDGPAVICYDNELIEYEEYWVNDRLHRLDGPAHIEYDNNCISKNERYYINGTGYTKKDYYIKLLKLKVLSL